MKKKKIVNIIFVSFVLIATTIITSCSSEFEDELIDISSVQQRERIEQLAKEYGLNVDFENAFATRAGEVSISEIEEEFKKMSSLIGEYDLINIGDENTIILESFNTNLLAPTSMPNESTENGKATLTSVETITKKENGQNVNHHVTFTVDVKWDLIIHNVAYIDTIKVSENSEDIPNEISDKHVQITGAAPGTIIFSAFIQLLGQFAGYRFNILGSYNISGGSGSLSLIPCSPSGDGLNTNNKEETDEMNEPQDFF